MEAYYNQSGVTLYNGDALACLRDLPADSVNCCITSPPYWGLRDYGVAGQLGLEVTPELYVWHMVQVFREVRRVLRSDGTLWLNLGDSYNSQPWQRKPEDKVGTKQSTNSGSNDTGSRNCPNLKPKDLIGIPWRVAFALQEDGWWLRSDIIWAKPAPMPESVTDRPTRSHEYIFLLAKSEKYYCDMEAVKEPAANGELFNGDYDKPGVLFGTATRNGRIDPAAEPKSWNGSSFTGERDVLLHPNVGRKSRPSKAKGSFNGKTEAMAETGQNAFRAVTEMRNLRDVWMVGPQPFPEAHFATFPPRLIEPCVIAGCPVGGLVLDPFTGAGTTALVAKEHGRRFVGTELKREYCEIAARRLSQEVLSFE